MIAKRRKPRPTGPPPARSPKAEREVACKAKNGSKRKPGETVPPSSHGVLDAGRDHSGGLRTGAGLHPAHQHDLRGRDRPDRLRDHVRIGLPHRALALPLADAQVDGLQGGPLSAGRLEAPRGTRDILPAEHRIRRQILDVAADMFALYGFGQLTTPPSSTPRFSRGVSG